MRLSLPRTMRGLAVLIAAVAGLIAALSGVATYIVVHEEIERQIDHRIELETFALLDLYRSEGFEALARIVDQRAHRATPGDTGYLAGVDEADRTMGYILVDRVGVRRAGMLRAVTPPPGWSEFVAFRRPDGREGVAQALNTALPGGGQLVVAADRAIVDQTDVALLRIFVAEFALILAILGLAAAGFAGIVRRRLAAIKDSAEAIMAGDMSRRMTLDGSQGEFDQVAAVLNAMLDRIARLLDSLRQLSGDLAHDLRTPLNRLRARLEQLDAAVTAPAERQAVSRALVEADKLLDLFAGLLAISEVEGLDARSRFAAVEMAPAIKEIVEAYRPAVEAAGLSLHADAGAGRVTGDRPLLQQAIANLLDNALAHTPAGTRVTVAGARVGSAYVVRVADNGPGVPPADRERVFQRMIRLDEARTTPGHGLGLSMVAAIAAAHAGSVRFAGDGPGAIVEFSIPTDAAS